MALFSQVFCTGCGIQNRIQSTFCFQCGNVLQKAIQNSDIDGKVKKERIIIELSPTPPPQPIQPPPLPIDTHNNHHRDSDPKQLVPALETPSRFAKYERRKNKNKNTIAEKRVISTHARWSKKDAQRLKIIVRKHKGKSWEKITDIYNKGASVERTEAAIYQYYKKHIEKYDVGSNSNTHKQTPWKCESCSRSFRSKQHLTAHKRTNHGGERQHMCGVCHKRFRLLSQLRTHTNNNNRNHRNRDKERKIKEKKEEATTILESILKEHRQLTKNELRNAFKRMTNFCGWDNGYGNLLGSFSNFLKNNHRFEIIDSGKRIFSVCLASVIYILSDDDESESCDTSLYKPSEDDEITESESDN